MVSNKAAGPVSGAEGPAEDRRQGGSPGQVQGGQAGGGGQAAELSALQLEGFWGFAEPGTDGAGKTTSLILDFVLRRIKATDFLFSLNRGMAE